MARKRPAATVTILEASSYEATGNGPNPQATLHFSTGSIRDAIAEADPRLRLSRSTVPKLCRSHPYQLTSLVTPAGLRSAMGTRIQRAPTTTTTTPRDGS